MNNFVDLGFMYCNDCHHVTKIKGQPESIFNICEECHDAKKVHYYEPHLQLKVNQP